MIFLDVACFAEFRDVLVQKDRRSYLAFAAAVSIELPVRQMTPAVAMPMIKMIAIVKTQQSHIVRRRDLVGLPIFFCSDIGRPHYPEPNGND